MAKEQKDSFVLHTKLLDIAISTLQSDEQIGKLLKSIVAYQKGEPYDTGDPLINLSMQFMINQLDIDNIKYEERCRKNKENISKRWGQKQNKSISNENVNTNEYDCISDDTKDTYNDNENDNYNDNDVSNETINKENISKKESSSSSPLSTAKVGDIILVKGCQVVKRSQGKIFKIPTQQEVESYITEKQYHFSASIFIDHYSNSSPHPWCKKDGTPVSNWKQCCTTFESTFLRSQGRISLNNQPRASEAHANINQRHYEQF